MIRRHTAIRDSTNLAKMNVILNLIKITALKMMASTCTRISISIKTLHTRIKLRGACCVNWKQLSQAVRDFFANSPQAQSVQAHCRHCNATCWDVRKLWQSCSTWSVLHCLTTLTPTPATNFMHAQLVPVPYGMMVTCKTTIHTLHNNYGWNQCL